ncbi:MAG TPA: response regulator [Sphingobacteriaceae bacterium]
MKQRILVIDDDPDIIEIINFILLEEGFDVITATSGDEIVNRTTLNVDLIILDLRITGSSKTGAEICAHLKSQPATRDLPVIIVSAEPDIQEIALKCGADACVQKPFTIGQLSEQVRHLLRAG